MTFLPCFTAALNLFFARDRLVLSSSNFSLLPSTLNSTLSTRQPCRPRLNCNPTRQNDRLPSGCRPRMLPTVFPRRSSSFLLHGDASTSLNSSTRYWRTVSSTAAARTCARIYSDRLNLCHAASPIPFDFLISSSLLRSSLGAYCAATNTSEEITLEIEYLPSTLPPQLESTLPSEDWVSDVSLAIRGCVFLSPLRAFLRLQRNRAARDRD